MSDKLKEELSKMLLRGSNYYPEDVWGKAISGAEPPLVSKVIKEFDREILKRIGDSLHMLMPNVEIAIRNAGIEVLRAVDGETEFFVLKMDIKFTAQNPEDFLKTPETPKEEVSRVFRVE